ncbi:MULTISPECIES: CGNR zinc finger domain-containing protein [Nocardiopsidaceae]|uniref:CGNR zinc finger domain-containing protein n=1 Tax=Streptomonospora nanhaiensis TaxID=1323731 RepID=A0ABY6YFM1_9ACTN|nr:CGNR zinc finger domain-containing protein [Streptomonospora nanhaiensis]WAE71048.1 CGNR zinc finger domain-containing protein [Streptomonospora nanhaiensis]
MIDEQALLEALNSTPVVDGRPRDLWADDAVLRRWAQEHGGPDEAPALDWLRTARDAVQAATRGPLPETELRRILAGAHRVPEVGREELRWPLHGPPERRLAVELVLAWYEVRARRPGRLRPCGNDECRLFLLDRSRANTARWCSMKTCGNRLKARRHQERVRQEPGA